MTYESALQQALTKWKQDGEWCCESCGMAAKKLEHITAFKNGFNAGHRFGLSDKFEIPTEAALKGEGK